MLELIAILSFLYTIFYLLVLWKFAVKTGNPGWSLYIPIYSNFVWCRIAGMDSIWCLMTFAPGIILKMYPGYSQIYLLVGIFYLILHFCFCNSLAQRFGKKMLFTLGLIFLNPIFLAILTFSKKCYYYRGY